ncbi:UBX domain protein Ubx2 [Rhinocladiella similis]
MDEAIASVVTVTGSTPEIAAQYVQLADGDPNQAVQLFFENGGADLGVAFQPPQPSTSSRPTGDAQNPINLDADEHISDDNDPEITGFRKSSRDAAPSRFTNDFEDDEAMARRLQEEMYGGNGVEHNVRAPIARQAETLVGPGADPFPTAGPEYDAALDERLRAFQRRRNPVRPGIFNQHEPPTSIWDSDVRDAEAGRGFLAESTGGASEASSRSTRLARLFQPPWDLMFKGEWDAARDEGKEHKKWLLVDIQDPSIFDCQALNRDLWKNEGIVDTVKENFVFIQYNKDDPRAGQYIQYYFPTYENQDEYPHVAIVDPRTGEQIKLWSRKVPSAAEFLMQLHEFLDRYSLDNNARNPVAKRKSEAKKEKPLDQLSEEEQLERALQASLGSQEIAEPNPVAAEDPDALTRSVGDVREVGNPSIAEAMDLDEPSTATTSETNPFSQIASDRPHVEPLAGPGITRVQIRHPGGRIVRRFAEADPVQRIYEFLKAEPLEGREGKDFELVSMGRNLIDFRQETIEAAGLKNGTVMVEFVE